MEEEIDEENLHYDYNPFFTKYKVKWWGKNVNKKPVLLTSAGKTFLYLYKLLSPYGGDLCVYNDNLVARIYFAGHGLRGCVGDFEYHRWGSDFDGGFQNIPEGVPYTIDELLKTR